MSRSRGGAPLGAAAGGRTRTSTCPPLTRSARVDTVVLACTHFPLLQAELAQAAPRPLSFVDGKEGIARRVAYLTRDRVWPDAPGEGIALFTGRDTDIDAYGRAFVDYGFTRMERL